MTPPRALPPGGRPAVGRGWARAPLLAALATLFLGLGVAPAQAHDALVASSPLGGAVLPTAPPAVQLEFSGTPLPLGTEVLVVGPDGRPVSAGNAEIRGTTVVQRLSEDLPAGAYAVEWRSASSDGHALTGTLDFSVTAGAPAAATPAASTGTATASADEPADGELPAGWSVAAVVAVGALGALLVLRLRRRR